MTLPEWLRVLVPLVYLVICVAQAVLLHRQRRLILRLQHDVVACRVGVGASGSQGPAVEIAYRRGFLLGAEQCVQVDADGTHALISRVEMSAN